METWYKHTERHAYKVYLKYKKPIVQLTNVLNLQINMSLCSPIAVL